VSADVSTAREHGRHLIFAHLCSRAVDTARGHTRVVCTEVY